MKQTIFSFLILLAQVCVGQLREIDSVSKKFDQYRKNALHEKIYAHLDRNFFLTGETLWIKLYTVDGTFHKPLDLSKVAYVEVLNNAQQPVLQGKIELKGGLGEGSFFIPATLASGNYLVRAYTNWMNNFGPEYYFHTNITIVNPFIKSPFDKPHAAAANHADFFPEGGHLVEGIAGKVGFKLSDPSGKGIAAQGAVINQQNDTIVRFTPQMFGLGHFSITPHAGDTYKAVVRDEHGKVSIHPFPAVQPSGYVLTLKDSGDLIYSQVTMKGNQAIPVIYQFVHARQMTVQAEGKLISGNKVIFTVRKSDLPEGIIHFTIFDSSLEPVCERLFFRQPQHALNITVTPDQREYGTRRKVSVKLRTEASAKSSAPASLSVSVYKLDSLSMGQSYGIYPYFWLTSDLGEVESPEFYLQKNDPRVAEAADNLMLTHGWRRFDWKEINGKKPELSFLPENRGHLIRGLVTPKYDTSAVDVLTYLASPSKTIRLYPARSNKKGEVFYEVKDLYGPRQLVVLAHKSESYQVQIQNPFSTKLAAVETPPFSLDPATERILTARSLAMQVQDIYYYDNFTNRFANPVSDTAAFYGKGDETYRLDDFTRFQVMEEVMREYVPGVFVRKRRDGFHFMVIDIPNGGAFNEDPMVLMDGVPVLNINTAMEIDPLKVQKLEVIKRRYYLGPTSFPGIVSYSSYKGNLEGLKLDPNANTINYEALQRKRIFYSPVYDTPQQRNNRLPDQRNLLYWNADVTTGPDGTAQIDFYTSDMTGEYLIVTEGLRTDGSCGSGAQTFSVKRFNN